MKEATYTNFEQLPLFLNAETLAKMLGVSVSSSYELMHEKDFPAIRIGSRLVVPIDKELIATEPIDIHTSQGKKLNGNLLYTILPIEQAKQYFYNCQFENIYRQIAEEKQMKHLERLNLKPNKQSV